MKKLLILTTLISCLYCDSTTNIYKEAQNLENQGKYKEAMLLYKKALNLKNKNLNKEALLKTSDEKNKSYDELRKKHFVKNLNKSENKETNKNIKEMASSHYGIYPYKKNYLLLSSYDFEKQADNRSQFETAFQISAKKPIAYNLFGLNGVLTAAYTQKSFWQTSRHSKPFRETNYLPELFMEFPYEKSEHLKSYKVSLIHESNGRNEEYSRSWNRVYLEGTFQFDNLFVTPKVWYRIPDTKEDDNPDIHDYYGYGDLKLLYAYGDHTFDLLLRNNLKLNSSNKGAAEFNWSFPLPSFLPSSKAYGFLQVFSGYGNSLIDYNHEVNKIGFGVAISR